MTEQAHFSNANAQQLAEMPLGGHGTAQFRSGHEAEHQQTDVCKILHCNNPAHNRRGICNDCAKATQVLDHYGRPVRFCQRCKRLHHVDDFKGFNRTCEAVLRARSRKRKHVDENAAAHTHQAAQSAAAGDVPQSFSHQRHPGAQPPTPFANSAPTAGNAAAFAAANRQSMPQMQAPNAALVHNYCPSFMNGMTMANLFPTAYPAASPANMQQQQQQGEETQTTGQAAHTEQQHPPNQSPQHPQPIGPDGSSRLGGNQGAEGTNTARTVMMARLQYLRNSLQSLENTAASMEPREATSLLVSSLQLISTLSSYLAVASASSTPNANAMPVFGNMGCSSSPFAPQAWQQQAQATYHGAKGNYEQEYTDNQSVAKGAASAQEQREQQERQKRRRVDESDSIRAHTPNNLHSDTTQIPAQEQSNEQEEGLANDRDADRGEEYELDSEQETLT